MGASEGNGQWGYYQDWVRENDGGEVVEAIMRGVEEGCGRGMERKKVIVLRYGDGGENWAHQDGNVTFPYQALLMLSRPGLDYDIESGHLYLAHQRHRMTSSKSHQDHHHLARFESAGDLAIFHAAGEWYHGMRTVRPAPGRGYCDRVALGLFQPA